MTTIDQGSQSQSSRRATGKAKTRQLRQGTRKSQGKKGDSAKQRVNKAKLEKQRREKRETKRQIELGYCDNVWLAEDSEIIKTELTLEDNPLFVVNSSKETSREYRRQIKTPKGDLLIQKVRIGRRKGSSKELGVLKQKDQEALYKLIELWQKKGCKLTLVDKRPRAILTTTAYELAMSFCGGDSGPSYDYMRSTIEALTTIPIYVENGFTRKGILEKWVEFTIMSVEWRGEGSGFGGHSSQVDIIFSSVITDSFMHGHVKPFSLAAYMELDNSKRNRCSAAKLLHRILDRELATKSQYNAALVPLFERLGMSAYKHKSQRKQKMQPTIDSLNKSLILADTHKVSVTLRPSRDRRDYVLVATKISIAELLHRILDRELATKSEYSSVLAPLLQELRMGPYEDKERRKRKIKPTVKILSKSLILGGTHKVVVDLKPSEDGEDYALVAVKTPAEPPKQTAETQPQVKQPALAAPAASELPDDYPAYPA